MSVFMLVTAIILDHVWMRHCFEKLDLVNQAVKWGMQDFNGNEMIVGFEASFVHSSIGAKIRFT